MVPGGFGYRGVEGMCVAAHYARTNQVPYLGLCLGFQMMVIEFGRHALCTSEVNSTEFIKRAAPNYRSYAGTARRGGYGGTMRLGSYPCRLVPGTRAASAYGEAVIHERHRHRFEVNNDYRDLLEQHGMVLSGLSPDGTLVEMAELKDHPWMLGSQFHPEFRSRPTRPHPLFRDFIAAAMTTKREGEQFSFVEGA